MCIQKKLPQELFDKNRINTHYLITRGSSKGRTTGSGSVYRGSNPCPRTSEKKFSLTRVRSNPCPRTNENYFYIDKGSFESLSQSQC